MADFAVRIVRIQHPVVDHPGADRLSLVRVGGYTAVTAKLFGAEADERGVPEGSHRYAQGDLVAYIPEAALLPEALLRSMGFWKDGRGTLAGSAGNRVKATKLRGIVSQGLLHPVISDASGSHALRAPAPGGDDTDASRAHAMTEGQDVADLLGITKYEPPIPIHMQGEVCNLFGHVARYDFESVQTLPDLFEPGMPVVATEKLHGTFFQAGHVPGLGYPDCPGDVYVTSKGMGNRGLGLKRNDANAGNIYVRTLGGLLDGGLGGRLADVSARNGGLPVRMFGEVFGRGVQDLHYGADKPAFRAFDIRIGDRWLPPAEFRATAAELGLDTVPELYAGPYDTAILEAARDGRTVLGEGHIREGIVIRAADGSDHPLHGRRIGKWVSPDYLLRKGAGEEVQ